MMTRGTANPLVAGGKPVISNKKINLESTDIPESVKSEENKFCADKLEATKNAFLHTLKDIEELAQSVLESMQNPPTQSFRNIVRARKTMAVIERNLNDCPLESRRLIFLNSNQNGLIPTISSLMLKSYFLGGIPSTWSTDLYKMHVSMLSIMNYATENHENKIMCARFFGASLLDLLQISRPLVLHRLCATVLMNLVKNVGDDNEWIQCHLPSEIELLQRTIQIIHSSRDGYLQLQLAEFLFHYFNAQRNHTEHVLDWMNAKVQDDMFQNRVEEEGKRLLKFITLLRLSGPVPHHELNRVLETFNQNVPNPNIVSVATRHITLHQITLRHCAVLFGRSSMLLSWNRPNLTVPYKHVRSIRIQEGPSLLFKLHSLPDHVAYEAQCVSNSDVYELFISFDETQLEMLKNSDIRKWILQEQTHPTWGTEGVVPLPITLDTTLRNSVIQEKDDSSTIHKMQESTTVHLHARAEEEFRSNSDAHKMMELLGREKVSPLTSSAGSESLSGRSTSHTVQSLLDSNKRWDLKNCELDSPFDSPSSKAFPIDDSNPKPICNREKEDKNVSIASSLLDPGEVPSIPRYETWHDRRWRKRTHEDEDQANYTEEVKMKRSETKMHSEGKFDHPSMVAHGTLIEHYSSSQTKSCSTSDDADFNFVPTISDSTRDFHEHSAPNGGNRSPPCPGMKLSTKIVPLSADFSPGTIDPGALRPKQFDATVMTSVPQLTGEDSAQEFEPIVRQLLQAISHEENTIKRFGTSTLINSVEELQQAAHTLRLHTGALCAKYLNEVTEAFSRLREVEHELTTRLNDRISKLNEQIAPIVMECRKMSCELQEQEDQFRYVTEQVKNNERKALLEVKVTMQKNIEAMKAQVEQISSHVQPAKFIMSYMTQKLMHTECPSL